MPGKPSSRPMGEVAWDVLGLAYHAGWRERAPQHCKTTTSVVKINMKACRASEKEALNSKQKKVKLGSTMVSRKQHD